jgi:TonB family protein
MRALMISVLLICSFGPGMAVQSNESTDLPPVVSAVAPIYPPIALSMNAKGEVVIEVSIDAAGKVVSATVVSGNEYLREASKQAAMKWQFGTVKESSKPPTARLTFVYRHGDATQPLRTRPEITTVFKPPYRVELISQPHIINRTLAGGSLSN